MTTEVCPDCLRPPATPAQWSNEHGDGNGCECAECVSVCWGDYAYCHSVAEERARKAKPDDDLSAQLATANAEIERLRAALEHLATRGEYETCIVCGRGMKSSVYLPEPHHSACVIGNALTPASTSKDGK
jgi:hypothetical protein